MITLVVQYNIVKSNISLSHIRFIHLEVGRLALRSDQILNRNNWIFQFGVSFQFQLNVCLFQITWEPNNNIRLDSEDIQQDNVELMLTYAQSYHYRDTQTTIISQVSDC